MEAVVGKIKNCYFTGAESKTCKLFSYRRNLFSNNANYDKESRHYCYCFENCCSTGTESEALKLLWRKHEDVAILQLCLKHGSSSVRIGGCCFAGAESRA